MGGETKISTNSHSQMLVSEKNGTNHGLSPMEFNFLVRPALNFNNHACQIAHCEDEEEDGDGQLHSSEEKQEDNFDMFVSSLKVKVPSAGEFCRVQQEGIGGDGDVEYGLKTPTSLDHKIKGSLQCPPAPRKPKSLPLKKRKAILDPRILLDFSSDEIESLFPPVDGVLADLGSKIIMKKKVRVQASEGHDHII
ncbi:hypothetical protein ACFX13_030139 [Malus domestica]|uniref:uncharacterized protein LOC126614591 n=1 Tax=Malus sylvestris TaxID=3752 RepID=UPI000498D583|nr:uncharacterized protein LOC103418812 [Malus domestica]XP_050138197.1 uncharacterized protein LOC126614591 [Malus sylvestris]